MNSEWLANHKKRANVHNYMENVSKRGCLTLCGMAMANTKCLDYYEMAS